MSANQDSLLRLLLVVLAVLLLAPLLMMTLAMPMMGMWFGMGPGFRGFSGGGLVAWLVVLAVVVGLGYVLYRGLSAGGPGRDPALEELRLAYARGDVSDEEYERRRERLRSEERVTDD